MAYEGPIQELIDELARLPGIGPKSAQRLAFYLVKAPVQDARRLAEAIVGAKERVRFCRECFSVSEGELCRICRDPGRDLSGSSSAPCLRAFQTSRKRSAAKLAGWLPWPPIAPRSAVAVRSMALSSSARSISPANAVLLP